MSQLNQNPETGWWTEGDGFRLVNTHDPKNCEGRGCAIHNHPSNHFLADAPLNWRVDRGILERICEHGVGHPDQDAAEYLSSRGAGYENVHGCDGCCGRPPRENSNYAN
jgi:hypothetical protein